MKKLLFMFVALMLCIACLASCESCNIIDSIIPCKHNETVTDAAVEPTCTEAGLTEGEHCAKCSEVLVKQESVPALGHETVIDEAKAPTCTENGLTTGTHCSVCNKILIAQESIPAEHTYGDWIDVTDADCFFAGEQKRVCTVCEHTDVQYFDTLEHSFVQDDETKLFSCEFCGAVIYAGHLYATLDYNSVWYDAYTLCEDLGGYLATITTAREQSLITEMMTTADQPIYWIGGIKSDGDWHWITGEEFEYTNWYTSMPDNSGGIEWFLQVYSHTANRTVGAWNDLDANMTRHGDVALRVSGLICEWDLDIVENEHYFTEWETITELSCFSNGEEWRICTHCGLEETRTFEQLEHNFVFNEAKGLTSCEHCNAAMYNGRIYKIFTKKLSWFEAYTYCSKLGGHLVTVTSEDEQTFIETYMNSESFRSPAWMGAYTDGNDFRWVTGEAFEYTNWKEGEPNCGNSSKNEFFAHFNFDTYFGFWNDWHPFEADIVGFICEWETE